MILPHFLLLQRIILGATSSQEGWKTKLTNRHCKNLLNSRYKVRSL